MTVQAHSIARGARWLTVLALVVCEPVFRPAWAGAQTERSCPDPEPATPADREQAQALVQRAFELHTELRYEETGETYRQALVHAQDPRIHLQAGIAFLSALRLLDAYEHLSQAIACGGDSIPSEELADARQMLERLRKRLGEVEVRCREPDAQVRFNDAPWFICAGRKTRVVVAGQYLVAVDKPGHVPVLVPVDVAAGQRVLVEPRLMSLSQATRVSRPVPRWLPWTVAGTGALVAAVGAGLGWRAHTDFLAYQRDLEDMCAPSCAIDEQDELKARYRRATLTDRAAVASLILGGTALATGLTLAFLNQPRTSQHPDAGRARIRVVPLVSADGAGITVGHRF